MAENSAEYRKERVMQKRDTNNLIAEKTEGGNIFEQQVFDVLEYIEKEANFQNNAIARKILKLKEFGITDEQIVEEYSKYGNSLENQNSAISNLTSVFAGLVGYINSLPNGIVIDLATAEKDDEKSFEQAIEYGIYSEDSIVEELNQSIKEDLKHYFADSDEKVSNFMDTFKDTFVNSIFANKEMNTEIDDFLNKNVRDMKLSENLKKIVTNTKDTIGSSTYEIDPHLFEICKLQVMLKESESSQEYNLVLSKIESFYREHPEYVARDLPVLNKDGSLNKYEIIEMQEYSEAYQRLIILKHQDTFNSLTPFELATLDIVEKRHLMMCAFSGLRYENDIEYQEIAIESMKMINQLYPNLDLNNSKDLASFFNKLSGFDTNFSSLTKDEIITIFSRQLKEATENYIENNQDIYRGQEIDFSKLDLDSSERIFFESAMENYFVGSEINFTAQDEDEYNKMYQDVTIESWIENKENAIKLRYAALTTIRDEYINNPVGTYTEKKLVEIERDIEEFERRFGKIDLTPKEGEVSFDVYRDDFVKAGLTKYLTRDAREWNQGANYAELTDEHKKGYIRNILVALDDNKDPNSYMTKIALRRLELMGEDFVKIYPNGEYEINEELILNEYKGLSDYDYSSFEQLAESAKLRKNEYLLKKLEEYTNLPESAFVELTDRSDSEASIAQIDQVRYLSNQKRIDQIVNEAESNEDIRSKTEERTKDEESEVIPDDVMRTAIKSGKIEVGEINIDISRDVVVDDAQILRGEAGENQEEQDVTDGETSTASEMKLDEIDVADITLFEEEVIQNSNDKPTFIQSIRNALAKAKDTISRFIKKEGKTKALGPGEEAKKEMTEDDEKTAQYNAVFRPTDVSQMPRVTEQKDSITHTAERDDTAR